MKVMKDGTSKSVYVKFFTMKAQSMQWHDYLLRFGHHSGHMRDSVVWNYAFLVSSSVTVVNLSYICAGHTNRGRGASRRGS